MIDRAETAGALESDCIKTSFCGMRLLVGERSLTMPSESSPLLQAQASAPGNSQVLNSPDPESHPKSIVEDGKAGSSQNVLTVIPLLLVGKLSE
jgi:hypothetical protein